MKLVKVVWRDISSVSLEGNEGAWISKETAIKQARKAFEKEYFTVGYLVEKNKDFIVISATLDNTDQDIADVSMIPSSVIKRIKELK